MGTKKDFNSEIDEDAVHVVEGIFRGGDWGRSKPQPDKVGLDMRVDMLEDRHPQIAFYLQIKGMGPKTRHGHDQPNESKTGTLNKAIELEHLQYYMRLPVPVFLVVVDVVLKVAYYVHVQRYVLEELKGDDWRERLDAYKATREIGGSGTAPTKTIRVPTSNVLSDTEVFKGVVREAKGFMASLSVREGIAYKEEALRRQDERFEVTYIKGKEGEHYQLSAKEPVDVKLRAKLPKDKFEAMFGKGLPVEMMPGDLTFLGSPILEKISPDVKAIQMSQQLQGFINIVRLDGSGQRVSILEYLHCDIEGGLNEWRFKTLLPLNLFTFGFCLDLGAIRDNPDATVTMNSNFTFQTNLASLQGRQLRSIPVPGRPHPVFCGIADGDRFRLELGLRGVGKFGGFTLEGGANALFALIGLFYEALHKARSIAEFFNLNTRMPAKIRSADLEQIEILYDFIQGRAVPSPQRFSRFKGSVERRRLAATLNSLSAQHHHDIAVRSEANFPFLSETVHVDNVVLVMSHARLISRKSDIKRRLKKGDEDVWLHFAPTEEFRQMVSLEGPSGEQVENAG